tara:strand:- start:763 stop:957 length:195 start_codon:yes stop_codon:yes gene_type:complete
MKSILDVSKDKPSLPMLSFSAEVLKAIGLKISYFPNKLSPPTLSFKVIGSPLLFWEKDPLANKF